MLGRLLDKLFRRRSAASEARHARPVSPPPPVVPPAQPAVSVPPPPPPPPAVAVPPAVVPNQGAPPIQAAASGAITTDAAPSDVPGIPANPPAESTGETEPDEVSDEMKVRLVLEDGTMASPGLDPESEERLRYILDNIVPPPDGPAT